MLKILIVDDAIFTRKLLRQILENQGHHVLEAVNGAESVRLYKNLKPDVVTMDIIMPKVEGIDGIGAVKDILKDDPSARIIMVSAMGQQEVIVEAIHAGAKDFIVKPFLPADITSKIEKVLENRT